MQILTWQAASAAISLLGWHCGNLPVHDAISAERLSVLVGLIYDSAIDAGKWPVAMDAIRIELGFHNATLNLQKLPSGELLTNVTCNIEPQYLPIMAEAGPDVVEQWGGEQVVRTLPLDRPALLTQANPAFDPATTTNRYFLAFAKPQELVDVMAIGLARDTRGIGTMAFGRHRAAGPIRDRELAVAELLIPHLQRAATINRMLDDIAMERETFVTAFEALAVPVVLVGSGLSIVHVNSAAQRLLERSEVIRSVNGVLAATSAGASSALAAAVKQAARDESTIGRRGLGIPVCGLDAVSGALHVLPVRPQRIEASHGAVAAVFVARADTPFVAPSEIVAALFSLTGTEARVFAHLASGNTLAATATALGIERSTAKTHLLRIFDKVGVRRQVDLVRIASSLAVPIAN